jgi:hypothetical protein
MIRRALILAAFAALVACGGGGGTSPVVSNQGSATAGNTLMGTAQIVITVPEVQPASTTRRPAYVSPATKSLVISANGTVVTVANLTPSSPGCSSGLPASTGRSLAASVTPKAGITCTVNADLPAGNTTIGFATFDQPGGLGNKLSIASVSKNIVASTINPVAVAMNGIVTNLTVTFDYGNGQPMLVQAEPSTVSVFVNALDASGNIIIAPGNYSDAQGNPVTVTLSQDQSFVTGEFGSLSTTTISAPGTSVTIRYNGRSPLTAIACNVEGGVDDGNRGIIIVPGTSRSISATIPNVATGTDAMEIANISGVLNPRNITVSNSGNNTVTSYFPYYGLSNSTATNVTYEAPTRNIGGSNTGFNVPQGVTYQNDNSIPALNCCGVLYVAGSSMSSFEGFGNANGACPGFQGNAAPTFTNGSIVSGYGMAVDASANNPTGNVTVACQLCVSGAPPPSVGRIPLAGFVDAVETFAHGAGGAQVRVLSGSLTGLSQPVGIAFDSTGNLYVANSGNNTITVYAPNSSGNVAPIRTITASGGVGPNNPKGLNLDINNNLYVANFGDNTVLVYAAGANGAAVPTRIYTGLSGPYGIAIRKVASGSNSLPPFNDIYVTNFNNNSVSIFDPTVAGSTPAFVYQGPDTGLSNPTFITFGD